MLKGLENMLVVVFVIGFGTIVTVLKELEEGVHRDTQMKFGYLDPKLGRLNSGTSTQDGGNVVSKYKFPV